MKAAEPIAWTTAERVAKRVAGSEPFSSSYLWKPLERDFASLTASAEQLVSQETKLVSARGAARIRLTDRQGWVRANVAAFQRLLGPLVERLAPKLAKSSFAPANRHVAGAQLGVVLGWMSTRVLGQYDLLLLEDDHPEDQDIVYYVGPNVLALEKRFAFPPKEFRLWLALHECTHRAQFTGVPWLSAYFRSQVDAILKEIDPEPKQLLSALKRMRDGANDGEEFVRNGGLLAMLATPRQQDALRAIYGLMALLEGHGDVTMQRAGGGLIPSAERFHRVLHERRSGAKGLSRFLQRLLGIEAKLRQYEEGERFIAEVESVGGPELFRRVWEGPKCLPSYEEIRRPGLWVQRIEPSLARNLHDQPAG